MAELIPIGATAAVSADFTLTDGQSTTLHLKSATPPQVWVGAHALVQIKSGTDYFNIGTLGGKDPAQVLSGAGTYRVSRGASTAAFGVDRD